MLTLITLMTLGLAALAVRRPQPQPVRARR